MAETPDWNAPLPQPNTVSVSSAALASESISTVQTIAGVAGRSIIVAGLGLSAGRLDIPSQGLRTLLQMVVSDNLVTFLDQLTIGPDMPSFDRYYPPGSLFCAVGNPLAIQVETEPGGGSQLCSVRLLYYLQ